MPRRKRTRPSAPQAPSSSRPRLPPAEAAAEHEAPHASRGLELGLMGFSVLIAVVGIALAWKFYVTSPEISESLAERWAGAHRVLSNKYYVDELYNATAIAGTMAGGPEPVELRPPGRRWRRERDRMGHDHRVVALRPGGSPRRRRRGQSSSAGRRRSRATGSGGSRPASFRTMRS